MELTTLQFWHKLEHFYPYILQGQKSDFIKTFTICDQKTFSDYENAVVPPDQQIREYCVYLGIFEVFIALEKAR